MSEIRDTLARLLMGGGRERSFTTTLAETRMPVGERPNYAVAMGIQKAPEPSNAGASDATDVDALIAESRKLLGDKADEILTAADLAAIKADPEVAKRFAKTLVSFREDHKQQLADEAARGAQAKVDAARAERARLANLGSALARAEREQ
jgi:hypothetical protein